MPGTAFAALALAYLLAGIPIGLLVGRSRGIDDIRKYGSGNIGATNVLRVLGVKAGLAVWVADCLKGVVPVLLGRHVFALEGWWLGAVALAAIVGHCYSPYLKLSGGKGVATGLGAMIGLYWLSGVCAFVLFVLIVARTRYISLGSVLAAASIPVWMLVFGMPRSYVVFAVVAATLIIFKHRENLKRLRAGTERKFGHREPATGNPADGKQ